MAQRVTLRKRQPYNTTSNRRRIVKTPGGKLVYHYTKKQATAPKCGDCGVGLPGVRRPAAYSLYYHHLFIAYSDPCSSPETVRDHLEEAEDSPSCLRRLALRRLCQIAVCL